MSYTWFRVDSSLADHPKVAELEVKLQNPLAGWYVIRLWSWTQRYATDGVIVTARVGQAEAYCRWPGKPGELIAVLVEVGLLDVQKKALEVHDWPEFQGKLVEKSRRDAQAKKDKRAKEKEEREEAARAGRTRGAPTYETDGRDGRTDEKPLSLQPLVADLGSGETEPTQRVNESPTTAHWGSVAKKLAAWMISQRKVAGNFEPDRPIDLAALDTWSLDWTLKHEPDDRAFDVMCEAFNGFLADGPGDRSFSLWCTESVWLKRWSDARAAAGLHLRALPAQRSLPEVAHAL